MLRNEQSNQISPDIEKDPDCKAWMLDVWYGCRHNKLTTKKRKLCTKTTGSITLAPLLFINANMEKLFTAMFYVMWCACGLRTFCRSGGSSGFTNKKTWSAHRLGYDVPIGPDPKRNVRGLGKDAKQRGTFFFLLWPPISPKTLNQQRPAKIVGAFFQLLNIKAAQ